MRIAVSGATGFVGAHLVRYFSNLGIEVIALGRQKFPNDKISKYAKWQQVDLLEEIENIEADVLIHAAGRSSDRGDFNTFYKSNMLGTKSIFEAFSGSHFVYISSASVYPMKDESLKEYDAIDFDNRSNYGKSKLLAEHYLSTQIDETKKITVLRPRAIYGTHDRVLLPKILGLLKKGKVIIPGDMDIQISMTHISNLELAVQKSIQNQNTSFEIYNVADDCVYNLRDIVKHLIDDTFGVNVQFKELPLSVFRVLSGLTDLFKIPFPLTRSALDYISMPCVLDQTKIKRELDFIPRTHFYNELKHLSRWIKKVGIQNIINADPLIPWML